MIESIGSPLITEGPLLANRADDIVVAMLNAPPVNAIDTAMQDALTELVNTVQGDDSVRVLVLCGSERIFAAGADIDFLANVEYEEIVHWNRRLQTLFTRIATLPIPVVAAVTGHALGGGLELALCADYRIASSRALLGLPEVQLGILPGSGGTQRLTQIVGRSTAKALIMTGRRLDAAAALELTIVDEVSEPESTLERAIEYARELAAGPAFAIRAIKEAVDGSAPVSETGLALERSLLAGLFATSDRRTGTRSFLENGPGKARFQ